MSIHTAKGLATFILSGLVIIGAGVAAAILAVTPIHRDSLIPPLSVVSQIPIEQLFGPDLMIKGPVSYRAPAQGPTSAIDTLFGPSGIVH
jgi:hypothetical protein